MDSYDIEFNEELGEFYVPALNYTYVRKDRVVCYCSLHECCVSINQSKKRHCLTCVHKRMEYKDEQIQNWSYLLFEDNSFDSNRYDGKNEDDYFNSLNLEFSGKQ